MTISFAAYSPRIDYDAELGTGVASQWDDQSGNGFHATQATASKQMAITSGTNLINGLPARRAMWATGTTGKCWDIPDGAFTGMTGAVGGEAFIVYMRDADPGGASGTVDGGVWQLGNGNSSWHPWPNNGNYYENFLSSARKDTIFVNNRKTNLKANIYNVWSATNDFGVLLNGGLKYGMSYTTATNTFQVPAAGAAKLGASGTSTDGGLGAFAFTGYIWRFLLFNRKLTGTERTNVTADLATYYLAMQGLDYGVARPFWMGGTRNPNAVLDTTFVHSQKLVTSRVIAEGAPFGSYLSDIRLDKGMATATRNSGGSLVTTGGGTGTTNVTTYYKMRAIDPDCGSLTYRTWVVQDEPDTTGALYGGARCGANPLTNITVLGSWQVTD